MLGANFNGISRIFIDVLIQMKMKRISIGENLYGLRNGQNMTRLSNTGNLVLQGSAVSQGIGVGTELMQRFCKEGDNCSAKVYLKKDVVIISIKYVNGVMKDADSWVNF